MFDRSSSARWRTAALLALLVALAGLLAAGALTARNRYLLRGLPGGLPQPVPEGGVRLGINVYLERYPVDELSETLAQIRRLGVTDIKQTFYYAESFDWSAAERLIEASYTAGLTMTPLLDGDPSQAFTPPPAATFGRWAGEFARRFGSRVSHYMIWDEPNLTSHWGNQPVNPDDYAALLAAAALAIRQSDGDAVIIAASLAPTIETGPDNLSEPLYLKALYDAGAADAFDIVAAKPYGFDTGPDDRDVDADRINFSRPILLRELMNAQGDEHKAIWAGNWGWNSLPAGWSGLQSIWGQVGEDQQAEWTVSALERAGREWPWMGVMFLENWEPDAPPDDPHWGFSIAGRLAASALTSYLAAQPANVAPPGFHPASPDDPAQRYEGTWEFSPEFGADIGQSGDKVTFTFSGTDIGLRVRRADFRARLYATIDGQPANALPHDENGAALVLTSPDPFDDYISTELLARDLAPGTHTLELVASRGWDQWAINGFSVGYRPPEVIPVVWVWLLRALVLLSTGLAFYASRRAEWGVTGRRVKQAFRALTNRTQLLLTAVAAALVIITGWLTWGQDALGIYRRLGDAGQLAATAAAATVFYVTPSFLAYGLALAVLFLLLVLRPAWGLALIAATAPFYVPPLPKPMVGYRFSPVEVFTLVTFAAWATRAVLDAGLAARRSGTRPPATPLLPPRMARADWAVLTFTLVATLSLLVTGKLDVALTEWRVVIVEPAIFYLLLRVIRPTGQEVWTVLDALVLSGVIVAMYGLWQYVTGQGLITAEGGLLRLRSIYGSPNNVALYLDRILPLLAAVYLLGKGSLQGRRRALYLLAALPVALALMLTFSKGGLFLGVPAGLLVVFWVWQRQNGRRTWPWAVGAVALGITAILAASRIPSLAPRLGLFGTTGFFRVNLWRAALNMAVDHPWLGVGLDNFLYAYRGRYILDAAWQEPNLNHPHNLVLDFATRLGLLGLLAGSWMIWEAGRALLRARRPGPGSQWTPVGAGLAGALAAMLAHGLVDHSFFLVDLAFVFFLILGLAVWLDADSSRDADGADPSASALQDG